MRTTRVGRGVRFAARFIPQPKGGHQGDAIGVILENERLQRAVPARLTLEEAMLVVSMLGEEIAKGRAYHERGAA